MLKSICNQISIIVFSRNNIVKDVLLNNGFTIPCYTDNIEIFKDALKNIDHHGIVVELSLSIRHSSELFHILSPIENRKPILKCGVDGDYLKTHSYENLISFKQQCIDKGYACVSRREERIPVKVPVIIGTIPPNNIIKPTLATMINFSSKGCFISLHIPNLLSLNIQDNVAISVYNNLDITTIAEIRWINDWEGYNNGIPGLGLKFIKNIEILKSFMINNKIWNIKNK